MTQDPKPPTDAPPELPAPGDIVPVAHLLSISGVEGKIALALKDLPGVTEVDVLWDIGTPGFMWTCRGAQLVAPVALRTDKALLVTQVQVPVDRRAWTPQALDAYCKALRANVIEALTKDPATPKIITPDVRAVRKPLAMGDPLRIAEP